MTIRLVETGWAREIASAIAEASDDLLVMSPFIKAFALQRFLSHGPKTVRVITRFNLADFAEGVTDISALRALLAAGARVRGVRNLHSKLYVFGVKRAIVTSANLTETALNRNHEFGLVTQDAEIVRTCRTYFDDLWRRGGVDLTASSVDAWDKIITHHRATGGRPNRSSGLGDFGADAGQSNLTLDKVPAIVADATQAFVKFLGEGNNRVSLSFSTIAEIERAGCHWAVAYPATKRPRAVKDDALIFIGRLTYSPNDIRIFGRAIAMHHVAGRDDATQDDIARRPWKATWSRYIRVHHAEFVAGAMENGVSLNQLMNTFGADAFAATKRNAALGVGNIDPRRAYQQQAAVELSSEGLTWLSEQLQLGFNAHGRVPIETLDSLDWPTLPIPASGSRGV